MTQLRCASPDWNVEMDRYDEIQARRDARLSKQVDWKSVSMGNVFVKVLDANSAQRNIDTKLEYVTRMIDSALRDPDSPIAHTILRQIVSTSAKTVIPLDGNDPIKAVMESLNAGDINIAEAEKLMGMLKSATEARLNLGVLDELGELHRDLIEIKKLSQNEIVLGDVDEDG